jgi:hypothetical protein
LNWGLTRQLFQNLGSYGQSVTRFTNTRLDTPSEPLVSEETRRLPFTLPSEVQRLRRSWREV